MQIYVIIPTRHRRMLSAAVRFGIIALTLLLLAWVPSYGQQLPSCGAPGWIGPEISTPPDANPDSNQTDEGAFGGKDLTTTFINPQTFEARFTAKAADNSGLTLLWCLSQGDCGMDGVLDWLKQAFDWATFYKGEITRQLDLTLSAPVGSTANVRVEVFFDGLQAAFAVWDPFCFCDFAHARAEVSADLNMQGPADAAMDTVFRLEPRVDETFWGLNITRVNPESSSAPRTMVNGQVLKLRGHVRSEARTENLGVAFALGMSQFSDPIDFSTPPLPIPNPGLRVRATILNVTPVLGASQSRVSAQLGEVATNGGTLCDGDSTDVQLTATSGTVVNNQDGTWSWSMPTSGGITSPRVTITANDREGGVTRTSFDLVPAVGIDIRPKTTKNIIDLREEGQVPVAVLAGPNFDPLNQLNRSSLLFGRTGTEDSLAHVGETQKPACAAADVNDDGLWDLVCGFQVHTAGFQCGDRFGLLRVVAPAFGGVQAEGRDSVQLVPCNSIQTPTVLHEGLPLYSGYSGVAASSDGATLYIASDDKIYSMPRAGAPPTQITVDHIGHPAGLAVSPDGNTVFATLRYGGLAERNPVVISVPVNGGAVGTVADLPADSQPGGVAVSPDGARLFIAAANPRATLLSVPVAGGLPVNILSGGGDDVIRDVDVAPSGTLFLGADLTDRILSVPGAGGTPSVLDSGGLAFVDPVHIAVSPDKATIFVLDPNIRVDARGTVVTSGGWNGAVFMGPAWGGAFSLLAVGGSDFLLMGGIDVSPDGSTLYFGGNRRDTGAPVVLSVPTGIRQ